MDSNVARASVRDRDYIDEHNVIERYLLGKLSDEEASAFEDAFAFDKALCNEIDAVEKLIHGLRGVEKRQARATAARPKSPSHEDEREPNAEDEHNTHTVSDEHGPKKAAIDKPANYLPLALAANVVLAVVVTLLFFQNRQLSLTSDSVVSQVNGPAISLEITRSSAAALPTLDYSDRWITLLISGVPPGTRTLTLRLLDDSRVVVLEETNVELNPLDPWIEWLVQGALLTPGVYELELRDSQQSVDGNIVSLTFEICGAEHPPNSSCPR